MKHIYFILIILALGINAQSQENNPLRYIYLAGGQDTSATGEHFKYHDCGTDVRDRSDSDKMITVRHYRKGMDEPGYILKDIYPKPDMEKKNILTDKADIGIPADTLTVYYIMPKIRMNPWDALNDLEDSLLRIEVYSYDGTLIMKTIMRNYDFLDMNGKYDGEYIEDFSYMRPVKQYITRGDILKKGMEQGGENKLDIRIYWYGKSDFWIEYIKFEDKTAYEYEKGYYNEFFRSGKYRLITK